MMDNEILEALSEDNSWVPIQIFCNIKKKMFKG